MQPVIRRWSILPATLTRSALLLNTTSYGTRQQQAVATSSQSMTKPIMILTFVTCIHKLCLPPYIRSCRLYEYEYPGLFCAVPVCDDKSLRQLCRAVPNHPCPKSRTSDPGSLDGSRTPGPGSRILKPGSWIHLDPGSGIQRIE